MTAPGDAIDWEGLRRRMAAVAQHLAHPELSRDEVRRVLADRAAALAQPHAPLGSAVRGDQVTFRLGEETFALEASQVAQVIRRGELATLPGAQRPVIGVTAWRGALLTLLDLRAILGLPGDSAATDPWIMILGSPQPEFGVLISGLGEVVPLAESAIEPAPPGGAIAPGYVRGLTRDAIVVLDARTLLLRHRPESTTAPGAVT